MYELHYYISLWISLVWPPKVIYKEVEVAKIVKDPNGFIQNDIKLLESFIAKKPYKVGDSLESVAYRQAQEDLLNVIKTKLIGRG